MNLSACICSVKARNHRAVHSGKLLLHQRLCFFRQKGPVLSKPDHLRRIHKGKTKTGRHDLPVQIFSSGSGIIPSDLRFEIYPYCFEVVLQGKLGSHSFYNIGITASDLRKRVQKLCLFFLLSGLIVTAVQKIRDLRIFIEPFSGCRRHDEPSALIASDNVRDFSDLLCVGE